MPRAKFDLNLSTRVPVAEQCTYYIRQTDRRKDI